MSGHFRNVNALYQAAISDVLSYGHASSPRGKHTLELIGESYTLDRSSYNILSIPERKLNYHFMLAEWLWISLGRNDAETIRPYNKTIADFAETGVFRGAYGPKWVEQYPYVLDVLRTDASSRQAVVTFWRERPRETRDVPCTVSLQFFLRKVGEMDVLDCVSYMRSNDVWWGMPYDIFTFTQLQQQLANILGVFPGKYVHNVGSLHLYEQHFEAARRVMHAPYIQWDAVGLDEPYIPAGSIPGSLETIFVGMSRMSQEEMWRGEDIQGWASPIAGVLPYPWNQILQVLSHRFHKNPAEVPENWRVLMGING